MREIIGFALMVPFAAIALYLLVYAIGAIGDSFDTDGQIIGVVYCAAFIMFVAGAFVIAI